MYEADDFCDLQQFSGYTYKKNIVDISFLYDFKARTVAKILVHL